MTMAKLESNSASEGSDLYFSAPPESLVDEEKKTGSNINHNSRQNSNHSQEQAAVFGHKQGQQTICEW